MSQVIPFNVEESPGIFDFSGGTELVFEIDSPTLLPGFVGSSLANTAIIRGDKNITFVARWTPGGLFGSNPMPGWNWQFRVINEKMGPNNVGEAIFTAPLQPQAGGVVHLASVFCPAGTYPAGEYHFTFILTLLDPAGNPTPVVALAHIDMMRIFSSAYG